MVYDLHCDDCVNYLTRVNQYSHLALIRQYWDTIFSDCPDNIGLRYKNYKDKLSKDDYVALLSKWLKLFVRQSRCVWFSYNAKWWSQVGRIVIELEAQYGKNIKVRNCIQVFTFGQHRQTDLGNNYRPLLRIMWKNAPLYPDAIRVPSWRQEHGDKRADPRGRVPSDVMAFPRVTGNSKQRRRYHPTQLHEGLVEQCIKLTTVPGEHVLDPFGGTGTTMRVCKRIDRACTLVEIDPFYCEKIAEEHGLNQRGNNERFSWT